MNLHDTLTELWRLAESGDIEQETRLESTAMRFQNMLFEYNDAMGENAMNEFIGPLELGKLPQGEINETTGIRGLSQSQRDEWSPFTFAEIDAIRHYYGQKIALENEGTIIGLGVPMMHELAGDAGDQWGENVPEIIETFPSTVDSNVKLLFTSIIFSTSLNISFNIFFSFLLLLFAIMYTS